MAKTKQRKKSGAVGGTSKGYGGHVGKPGAGANRKALIAAGLLVVAGAAYWWQSGQSETETADAFGLLVQEGQPVLARVRSPASQGNEHLNAGATKNYVEPFPTSGDHAPQGVKAGFYDRELPKVNLVHALEHGNVVIYYDTPGEAALASLKDWAGRFTGPWDGLVVTLSPGLGKAVVLTAWTKSLRMKEFDPAGAAAFVDAYRGRGPENPVR
jgi:hypothetical protein